jgi:hypothetical protein
MLGLIETLEDKTGFPLRELIIGEGIRDEYGSHQRTHKL